MDNLKSTHRGEVSRLNATIDALITDSAGLEEKHLQDMADISTDAKAKAVQQLERYSTLLQKFSSASSQAVIWLSVSSSLSSSIERLDARAKAESQVIASTTDPALPVKADKSTNVTSLTPATSEDEGNASIAPSEASSQLPDDSSKAAWYGAIIDLQQCLAGLAGPTHQLPKCTTFTQQPVELSEEAKQQSEGWCDTLQKAAEALQMTDFNLAVALYDQVPHAMRSCPALSQCTGFAESASSS